MSAAPVPATASGPGHASPCKVLFVAFDAAEMDLLLRWAEAGDLPHFRQLRDDGAWGRIEMPFGFGSGATWFTLLTAVNLAQHGRYFAFQVFPGSYEHRKFTSEDIKRDPVWAYLSRGGRRVGIVDIPYAPFVGEVNGIVVADWITHSPLHDRTCSWPPELVDELVAEFGDDTIGNCDFFKGQTDRYADLQSLLLKRIETKSDAVSKLLDRGEWDLFMTAFADSHCVGHQSWHLHDPSHPEHDPDWVERNGDPVREVYRALDAALGRLLQQIGSDTFVVFLAGPGMQANYGANYLLDQVLRHLEAGPKSAEDTKLDGLQKAWRRLPMGVRRFASPLSRGFLSSERRKRKCFAVPHNEITGAIRVNVVGREPHGLVQAGAEYDAFCEQLAEDLLALVNLDTGEPAVREVIRTHDLFEGEFLDAIPDLMVVWNRTHPIRRLGSPKLSEISQAYPGVRTGDHSTHMMFVARGPGIAKGQIAEQPQVQDLMPTIASYLGTSLDDVEGRPIEALMPRTSVDSPAHGEAKR